jgi:hypothetical protein
MNPDSENFDSLRRLLALKRHEQPPPGHFDRFSRDVMARIKNGENGDKAKSELPWLRRLLGVFDAKPVFAGAFGTAVCAFLITGVVSSETAPVMTQNAGRTSFASGNALGAGADPLSTVSATIAEQSANSNTNPLVSLFDQVSLQATPVSDRYYLPAGN